jgi:flavodoxin
MKKLTVMILSAILFFSLTACSGEKEDANQTTQTKTSSNKIEESEKIVENESSQTVDEVSENPEPVSDEGSILIAYFSVPEDVDTDGADAIAGASIVVKDGEKLGNVQYIAQTIQEMIGGDLFRIETVQQYPLDHETLVNQASDEQAADARPELASHIENPEQYDTIILGYPNWWGDMPQPLYTFLEEYDFSGKTIIPFCPHGGSGFSRTESTIQKMQPNATVSSNSYKVSREDVVDSTEDVIAWTKSLGLGN